MKKLIILPLSLLVILFGCNSNGNENETDNNQEDNPVENITPGNPVCNQLIADYDQLVERSIQYTEAAMSGNPPSEEETKALQAEAEKLSKEITILGMEGIGGAACWQEFTAIQLKWSQAALKLNQQALDQVDELMQQYGNQ